MTSCHVYYYILGFLILVVFSKLSSKIKWAYLHKQSFFAIYFFTLYWFRCSINENIHDFTYMTLRTHVSMRFVLPNYDLYHHRKIVFLTFFLSMNAGYRKLDYIHNVIYVKNKSFSTRLLTTGPSGKNVCDGSEGHINSYRIKKKLVIC